MFKLYRIITIFVFSMVCFKGKAGERADKKLYNYDKIPIVYHTRYNINFFGLEKFLLGNPFGAERIFERLKNYFEWNDDKFLTPRQATDEELKEFHAPEYIDSLNQSWKELFIRAAGFGLLLAGLSRFMNLLNHRIKLIIFSIYALWGLRPFQARAYAQAIDNTHESIMLYLFIPGPILRYFILDRMKYAVNGTKIALEKALDPNGPGMCINLLGGYTNACSKNGGNLCFFNDIALVLQEQITKNKNFKALIIDLGLCCGNANIDFAKKYRNNVDIIDIHSYQQYPFRSIHLEHKYFTENGQSVGDLISMTPYGLDENEKNKANNTIIQICTNGNQYLKIIQASLSKIKNQNFNCIIFNATTDIYKNDNVSALSFGITQQNVIERDEIIFQFACKNKIPFVMLTASGWDQQKSADLLADSLINILKK